MSIAASEGVPELLERKVRLRCRSGGSNAWVGSRSNGYAFPGHRKGRARVEKATVSRTLEVGRLTLGVACAGSQRPALGASLPDVHEGLTGRGRHLLLPETDLLTPPPSPPSVVQLGVTGVPPVERSVAMQVCPYTVSTQQGKPCLLFRACRYSSGRRGLCGLWRCCLHLMLRRYCRFFRLKALRNMHGGGYDPEVLKELRTAPDLAPRATKVMARSLGRAMSTLVVQERHLAVSGWHRDADKFGSSRFLYPRLASSATQPVTWPSSSRLHRSRLRRSNTSCLGGQLLPYPSAGCSAQPARRRGRPPASTPAPAPQPQQPPKAVPLS